MFARFRSQSRDKETDFARVSAIRTATRSALAEAKSEAAGLKGRIEDWADESLEVGRQAYTVPGSKRVLRTGDSLGRDYERANLPLVTDRVARSGVRLAALLNEVLKDVPAPISNGAARAPR